MGLKRKKIKISLEQMMITKRPKRRMIMNLRMVQMEAGPEGPEVHQVKIHPKRLLDQVKLKSLQPVATRPRRNLAEKKTRKNRSRTKVIISTRAAIITRKVTSTEVIIVTEAKKIIIVTTSIVIIRIVITRVILTKRIINVITNLIVNLITNLNVNPIINL